MVISSKTITDISMSYNYSSQQTFNRAFTAYFGISPFKYREAGMLDDLYKPFIAKKLPLDEIKTISVELEELPPMKAASYHSYSENISLKNALRDQDKLVSKTWGNLVRWQMAYEYRKRFGVIQKLPSTLKLADFMIDNRLHLPPNTRYFGFNNPFPCRDSEFGYEAWAVLTDISECALSAVQNSDIFIKSFGGGLYAAADATYGPNSNLDETWKKCTNGWHKTGSMNMVIINGWKNTLRKQTEAVSMASNYIWRFGPYVPNRRKVLLLNVYAKEEGRSKAYEVLNA